GQIGIGTTTNVSAPTAVAAGSTWLNVSVGNEHACGLRSDGQILCWGSNFGGQVGTGPTPPDTTVPNPIASAFSDWIVVAAGGEHSCAVRSGGQLSCWGSDD